jgi:hypothetical protein
VHSVYRYYVIISIHGAQRKLDEVGHDTNRYFQPIIQRSCGSVFKSEHLSDVIIEESLIVFVFDKVF